MDKDLMNDQPEKENLEDTELTKTQEAPAPGERRFVGKVIDNKRHGVVEKYDENANLISSHTFEKGRLHGEAQRYDKSQRLKDKITYHEGVAHGPAEF